MVYRPENSDVTSKVTPNISQPSSNPIQRIPFPKPSEARPLGREIKAKILTGSDLLNSAINTIKSLSIVKFFSVFFSSKPKHLSPDEAKIKVLNDAGFAKKFGAALDLYLDREAKLKLFSEFNIKFLNMTIQEKKNLNVFISTFVLHADPDEIDYLESRSALSNLFDLMRQDEIATRTDTIVDRYRHLTNASSGKASLDHDLEQIRRGSHFNRDEFLELMASSLTKQASEGLSKLRLGEIAALARQDVDEKTASLSSVVKDSYRLMEAIRRDIIGNSESIDKEGIKNSFEFYIELAEHLAKQGDAHNFIIVLAVLADPEMKPILDNADISSEHREILKNLDKKADAIDTSGNLPENPKIPSILLLIDRFKDATRGKSLDVISDEFMIPFENAMSALGRVQVSEPPLYNISSFIKSRSIPADLEKAKDNLESDINQIYAALEKAESNQKLRITPEGLISKKRSIFSRFTDSRAGIKDPAKNAVQHILAKVERALDQENPPLEKIGHILNFLNQHTWSKIVLNKNEQLQSALINIEKKYESKINKEEADRKLYNSTSTGISMIESFLKDIDDSRRLVLIRTLYGNYNIRSNTEASSKATLENLYRLLQDAAKYPDLKEKAVEMLNNLYKTSWFEESLKKHKQIGDDIINLGRQLAQKWEAPDVPQ